MRHRILMSLLIGLLTSTLTGQTVIEDSKFKFWQPDTKLVPADFKADTTKAFNNLHRKFNFEAFSFCTIKSVLDVPKKKRDRGKKLEKVYIAPCIDKFQSISISSDSAVMAKQQIFFDITELFARRARQEFHHLLDTMGHSYGVYWSMYSTVISDMCINKNKMTDQYLKDVMIERNPGAYEKWRKVIDALLSQSNEYATKPEDCLRIMTDAPLTDDYEKSPDYLGEIKCHRD